MHLLPELEKNCRLESIGIGCHECRGDSQHNLLHIIKNCHNDLWTWLVQKTENIDNVIYFQVHIGHAKSKEVIYSLLFKENDSQKVFYPLILDLNHCIYKVSKEKNYRYKYDKKWVEWDFSSKRKEIYETILKKLNHYIF